MNQKRSSLILLLLVSLVIPLVEVQVNGTVEIFGKFSAVQAGISALAIYWWYYLDKRQIEFRAGIFQNIGVVVLSIIALPVYFVRSRGWKSGGMSILKAFGFLVVMNILSIVGEMAGREIAF